MIGIVMKWFEDSLVQSLILSPLMGVILGALFSGFNQSPSVFNTITVKETRVEYRERIIYRDRGHNSSNSHDFFSIVICLAGAIAWLSWQYIYHSEMILWLLFNFLSATVCFSSTVLLVSFLKGYFTDESWWLSVLIPLLTLFSGFYLLFLAVTAIDSELIEVAKSGSVTDFFFSNLTNYGLHYVTSQLLGVICLVILILLNTLAELHYLALMNQRGDGIFGKFWESIARFTWKFFGRMIPFISIFLWTCSFILIEGHAAKWMIDS